MKEIIDKLDFIKIKNFCSSKENEELEDKQPNYKVGKRFEKTPHQK